MTNTVTTDSPGSIPARTGLGLRAPHYADVIDSCPRVGFFEVHSENFFGAGGYALEVLDQVRTNTPISLHGVGLSLGSTDPLNKVHLAQLATLVSRVEPFIVSEHLKLVVVRRRVLQRFAPITLHPRDAEPCQRADRPRPKPTGSSDRN